MQVKATFLSLVHTAGRNKALSTGSAPCADSSTTASEKASSALTAGPRCGQWWLGNAWNVWTLFEKSVTIRASNPRIQTRADCFCAACWSYRWSTQQSQDASSGKVVAPEARGLGSNNVLRQFERAYEPTGWELVFVTSYKKLAGKEA